MSGVDSAPCQALVGESESESRSVMSNSLPSHGLYSPWNSPGQNTGVGSFSLLQGIFPTQGSNPGLPHCRQILYQLSHQVGEGPMQSMAGVPRSKVEPLALGFRESLGESK